MAKNYRVAVIAGDGIGREVVPEGVAVMEVAARRYGFTLQWSEFNWSCETYAKTGRMMPVDGIERLRLFDAVFLAAVGHPGGPDPASLWGGSGARVPPGGSEPSSGGHCFVCRTRGWRRRVVCERRWGVRGVPGRIVN